MSRPRYSIAGELGKGGFGVVYLIKSDDGPKLALKTVDLRKIPPDYKARATEEAKILDQLNHKFLVHHVNSYIREPYLCIITEYCAAGDLDKFIERLGFVSGLPEKLIVCWLQQTASALDYMHTHNPVVLHRDLKPQNIYVTETGDVRLGDLGLARKLAGPQDLANTVAGTIVYISPEMLAQKPYNSKTDIWSLGCVFYDITGKQGGAEMGAMFLLLQVMGGRRLPLPDTYSQGLRSVITNMLTKDPHTRPSAATVLASPVVQAFERNPERPVDIITAFANSKRRPVPKIEQDLSRMRPPYYSPLRSDEINVPREKLESMQRETNTHAVRPLPKPRTVQQTHAVEGMSPNSFAMIRGAYGGSGGGGGGGGGGGSDDDAGATGGSDTSDDTFFDSNQEAEFGEEHFLMRIQQLQGECISEIGEDVLQAAYGLIDNVHDLPTLKKDLEELLGKSKYSRLGLKIVELQALEYGLYKKLKSMKRLPHRGGRGGRGGARRSSRTECNLS